MKKDAPMKTAKFVLVTPAMAQEMIRINLTNRRLRRWWVSALASAIKRGEYVCTHQGVAISVSGVLLDGQHRLEAIIESGVAVEMLVVTGIPDEAFGVIDCGIKRTVSDLTGLPKKTSEVARLIASFTFGGTVSAAQVLQVAESGVAEAHATLETYSTRTVKNYSSGPVRAAAVLLMMDGHSEALIGNAYASLVRQDFSAMSPALHALVRQVGNGKFKANDSRDAFARALKALNPTERELTKLQVEPNNVEASIAWARSLMRKALPA